MQEEKDYFEFKPLAENIAEDILNNLNSNSCPPIINIRGKWGLGKSSLADLIKEKIEEKIEQKTEQKIKVKKIDTWLVNDQKGIFQYISSKILGTNQNFHFRISSILSKIPSLLWVSFGILTLGFLGFFLANEIMVVCQFNFQSCSFDLKKFTEYFFQVICFIASLIFVYFLDKDLREPYQLKDFFKKYYKEKTVIIFDELDNVSSMSR